MSNKDNPEMEQDLRLSIARVKHEAALKDRLPKADKTERKILRNATVRNMKQTG